jgi:hypothetical protein
MKNREINSAAPTAKAPTTKPLGLELDFRVDSLAGAPNTILVDSQERVYIERTSGYDEGLEVKTDGIWKLASELSDGDLEPVTIKEALEWRVGVEPYHVDGTGSTTTLMRLAAAALPA